MKRALLRNLGLALLPLALLSGCATGYLLENDVQSFSSLPAMPATPVYRYERLPSQQADANQAGLEEMAGASLHRAGLRRDDAAARYTVQISATVQAMVSPWANAWDPWGPWGMAGFGIGVHGRRGVGVGIGYGGLRQPDPPWAHREVRVIVRELAGNRVVFESRATTDGPWLDPNAVLPAMFDAALAGFPNPPAGPRRVRLQLGPSGAVAVPNVPASEVSVTPSPAGIPISPPTPR